MKKLNVAVIGGGASGMAAAIEAAKMGAQVTILEHTDRLGKKILSTGNGKCNLANMDMSPDYYYSHDPEKVKQCLERFSTEETISLFESLGLCVKNKNGYLYPLAEQAAVVLDVLRFAVERYGIKVIYQSQVNKIYPVANKVDTICVESGSEKKYFNRVILACGSKAAPKTGSDGSGYELAKQLGHKILPVLPSLVQLKCSDDFCKSIAGIRAEAEVHILAGDKLLCKERGELQLTDYGISGIPVFQLSGAVNRYLYETGTLKRRNKSEETSVQNLSEAGLIAKIDFLPHMEESSFDTMVHKRCKDLSQFTNRTVEEFFTGMLNKKLMMLLIKKAGLQPSAEVSTVKYAQLKNVFNLCRNLELHITGSNGFDQAQVCTGGVDLREVTTELESTKVKGIYFAGEILDVDGRCGGYNLQWAWTSGMIAGRAAAGSE